MRHSSECCTGLEYLHLHKSVNVSDIPSTPFVVLTCTSCGFAGSALPYSLAHANDCISCRGFSHPISHVLLYSVRRILAGWKIL